MKIFLAGAGGAIGRRLTPLLRATGHTVVGTTRSKDKAAALEALGAQPVVVDVFDAEALARAVKAAAAQVLMWCYIPSTVVGIAGRARTWRRGSGSRRRRTSAAS